MPLSFGRLHLALRWPEFMRRHSEVTLDIASGDRMVDLVEEGFDLAVRIAQLRSSSLISRSLGSTRMVLCAAPAYLQRRGAPLQPDDLAAHEVISYSLLAMGENWEFTGSTGGSTVRVQPRLRTNSGDSCLAAALQVQGTILQPTFLVGADLACGALVEL